MDLTANQVAILERFLEAGFTLRTLDHLERYLAVEKSGFVALLDPSSERLTLFGQVGYRMGKNIGMLVERGAGKCFVWKNESLPASPELLAGYEQFKSDVERLLLEDRGLEGEG